MSLLLKALEKSEEEKKEGDAPAGQPSGASGGFKLSGGGDAQPKSKLGSAIASRQVKSEDAERVVAAYDQASEDETDLVAASRKQNIKRLVFALVIVAVGGVGYYAYQEFAPGLLGTGEVASTTTTQADDTSSAIATAGQAQLLPLPEPIYDIQESILIASLDPSANLTTQDAEEDNIAKQVTDVVASIIQEQEDEKRRNFLLSQVEITQQESLEEEIEGLLSQSFDPDAARNISTLDQVAMLEQLDALSQRVYDTKSFTFKPTNYVAKIEDEGGDAAPAKPVVAPSDTVQLTANEDKTKDLIEQGSLNYRYGNLLEAEKAFRTVIASQPTNVNALLGLAKVHQSRGNRKLALSTLLKASEYAPNDPNIAGELIALQAESASAQVVEQRILAMLSRTENPAVRAKLLFSLGNAYARERAWLEARNAYRAATELNKDNPDYLFNLAVMSDYMMDKEGALRYYQGALDASRSSPSSFDHAAARKRVGELQSVL